MFQIMHPQILIDITFDVYGTNGSTYLNATDGNRAYNEFVCQLMDELRPLQGLA